MHDDAGIFGPAHLFLPEGQPRAAEGEFFSGSDHRDIQCDGGIREPLSLLVVRRPSHTPVRAVGVRDVAGMAAGLAGVSFHRGQKRDHLLCHFLIDLFKAGNNFQGFFGRMFFKNGSDCRSIVDAVSYFRYCV